MAEKLASLRQKGGGDISLKDWYRDKVLNGTFDDTCTETIFQNRISINEGGCKVDTTNHEVYFYYDFTVLSASGGWSIQAQFSNNLSNYLPMYGANNRDTLLALTTDETSSNNVGFCLGYAASSYPRMFSTQYGAGINVGERYIVYGSWTY